MRKTSRQYGAAVAEIRQKASLWTITKHDLFLPANSESAGALLRQLAREGVLRIVRQGTAGGKTPTSYRAEIKQNQR